MSTKVDIDICRAPLDKTTRFHSDDLSKHTPPKVVVATPPPLEDLNEAVRKLLNDIEGFDNYMSYPLSLSLENTI